MNINSKFLAESALPFGEDAGRLEDSDYESDLVALSLKDLFDPRGEGVFSLQDTNLTLLGSNPYKWYFSPDSHTA